MKHRTSNMGQRASPTLLTHWQLVWLAAAVFVASAGYGALMPLLPRWLVTMMPDATPMEVARHVGMLSGVYAAGVLVGAPLWGFASDRLGRGRILAIGMLGYVASVLLLLAPQLYQMLGVYAMRAAAGFFVAAVVPIVPALVAAHTPAANRARRFAWLGAMSLLGFLSGPGLIALAEVIARRLGGILPGSPTLTQIVIVLSALLGAITMFGLAATLPARTADETDRPAAKGGRHAASAAPLWLLNGVVMFVLSVFELGIVLQGQQHASLSSGDIATMFAECSVVMLLVNGFLFATSFLERAAPQLVACAGLLLAVAGLLVLGLHRSSMWLYGGISLTAAGTGLVLPLASYLAASASRGVLGTTMGGLAAAAGLGQTLGSAAGGWLFGAVGQQTFFWLIVPLGLMAGLVVTRPLWWTAMGHRPKPGDSNREPLESQPVRLDG